MKTLADTFHFARAAHEGQRRRGGLDYFRGRVMPVWDRVRVRFGDEKIQMVALLHDTLEETDITAIQLLDEGFDEDVVFAVQLLTKQKGESYKDYLKEIKKNELARQVKIQDMIHNLSDDPTDRQIKKYGEGLAYLVS